MCDADNSTKKPTSLPPEAGATTTAEASSTISTTGTTTSTTSTTTTPHNNRWHVESLLVKLANLSGDHHRPSITPFYPILFPATCQPLPGESIEVSGSPSSGKTRLIFELIAHTILPRSHGGHSANCCYIQTKHHDNNRLSVLASILERTVREHHATNVQQIVNESMARMIIHRCPTRAALTITISNIDATLLHDDRYSLIVLDSVATFYWLEVAAQQQRIRIDRYVSDLVGKIAKAARHHGLLLVYGRPKEFLSAAAAPRHRGNADDDTIAWQSADYRIELADRNAADESALRVREAHLMCDKRQAANIVKEFTINRCGIEWM